MAASTPLYTLDTPSFLIILDKISGKDGTGLPGFNWPYSCMRTLARSIGWITTEANVAAEPPQTKGSASLAIEVSGMVWLSRSSAENNESING